jgi:hypothetical protein
MGPKGGIWGLTDDPWPLGWQAFAAATVQFCQVFHFAWRSWFSRSGYRCYGKSVHGV